MFSMALHECFIEMSHCLLTLNYSTLSNQLAHTVEWTRPVTVRLLLLIFETICKFVK